MIILIIHDILTRVNPVTHTRTPRTPLTPLTLTQRRLESSFDVFVAILAHKGLASYALGTSLLESNVTVGRFNAIVWFFAVATPVGIFLGFAISAFANPTFGAGATALASGTFIYVAAMEVTDGLTRWIPL